MNRPPLEVRRGVAYWTLYLVAYFGATLALTLANSTFVMIRYQETQDSQSLDKLRMAFALAALVGPLRDLVKVGFWTALTGLIAKVLGERITWTAFALQNARAEVLALVIWAVAAVINSFVSIGPLTAQLGAVGLGGASGPSGMTLGLLALSLSSPASLGWAAFLATRLRSETRWNVTSSVIGPVLLLLIRASLGVLVGRLVAQV